MRKAAGEGAAVKRSKLIVVPPTAMSETSLMAKHENSVSPDNPPLICG